MRRFMDAIGRSWLVAVNVEAVKQVRAMLDIDLLEAADGTLIERLGRDPVLLCDLLYVLCKPQADREGISSAQFGEALYGDAIDHATSALLGEIVDFFQKGRRELLAKAMERSKEIEARAYEILMSRLEDPAFTEETLTRIEQSIRQAPDTGNTYGTSRESLESTPTP